ncbi:MAG: phosphotransferase [Clostridia bacterium]|nr:phosphotransferase [Clostridia bacterium]
MDAYGLKIKDYLMHALVAKAYNLSGDCHVSFLAQGEYNKNYMVTEGDSKYVFRINMGSQLNLKNQIEYEFNAIKKLEKSGVTPTAYFCDDSRTYFEEGILMMNYLSGRPLNYETDLEVAAKIFGSIHKLDSSDFRDTLIVEEALCKARLTEADHWLSSFRASSAPSVASKRIMEAFYSYCARNAEAVDAYFREDPWQVVNNTEVNSHNFIIGEKESFLIDWEKPVISEPVQDITQFLAPTTTLWKTDTRLTDKETDAFFSTYEKIMGRPIKERVKAYEPNVIKLIYII